MSYELRGLGQLGWLIDDYATLGLTDSDQIKPTSALCGSAKVIQSSLRDLGYYTGPIDGQLGSGSVAAISKFSVDKGLGKITWPNAAFCTALKKAMEEKLAAAFTAAHPTETGPGGGGDVVPGGGSGQTTTPVVSGGGGTTASGGQSGSTTAPTEATSTKTYLWIGAGVLGLIGVCVIAFGMSKDDKEMRANRRGSRRRSRRSSSL